MHWETAESITCQWIYNHLLSHSFSERRIHRSGHLVDPWYRVSTYDIVPQTTVPLLAKWERNLVQKKNRADSWAIGKFCDWPTFGMTAWILSKHFPRLMPSTHVLYCWCGFKFVSTRLLAVMPGPPFHLQFASGRSHKSWLCQNALKYHRSTHICSSQTEAKSFQDAQSLLLDEVNLCARPKRQTQNSWVWHIKTY